MKRVRRLYSFAGCTRAASAVEFALVCPLLLAMLFGIIVFGSYLAVVHGVQQLAAEAARASVAGLTDTERATLARESVAANAGSYPFIDPARLNVDPTAVDAEGHVFRVSVRYDASPLFVFHLPGFGPTPPPTIVRTAVIQRGGY